MALMANAPNRRFLWTLETCFADAAKHTTRSGWMRASGGAYNAARRHGWIDACCAHMPMTMKPKGYWTKERCIEDAQKSAARSAWAKRSPAAYRAASQNGWFEECTRHMPRIGNQEFRRIYVFEHPDRTAYVGLSYWPDRRYRDHLAAKGELARRHSEGGQVFKVVSEYLPKDAAATKEGEVIRQYHAAGWTMLNKASGGSLGGRSVIWTLETCKEDALKYTSKKAWRLSNESAYQIASRNGWTDVCCAHMTSPRRARGYWTFDRCMEDARKFESSAAWEKYSHPAYEASRRNGWLVACRAHMTRSRRARTA